MFHHGTVEHLKRMEQVEHVLLPNHLPGVAGITIYVENTQRNGVFACGWHRKLDRITLSRAVGNAVVCVNPLPFAAVYTVLGTRQITRRINRIENDPSLVARYLRRVDCGDHGCGVVDIDRFR